MEPSDTPVFTSPGWILLTFDGHFAKIRKLAVTAFWADAEGHCHVLIEGLGVKQVAEHLEYLEEMLDARGI